MARKIQFLSTVHGNFDILRLHNIVLLQQYDIIFFQRDVSSDIFIEY